MLLQGGRQGAFSLTGIAGRLVHRMATASAPAGSPPPMARTPSTPRRAPPPPALARHHGGAAYWSNRTIMRSGNPCAGAPRVARLGSYAKPSGRGRVAAWVAAAESTDLPPRAEQPPPPPQTQQRKKKLPPLPTQVVPPEMPAMETWQNAMVLIDKPMDWTSFDLCGKLRGALRIKKVGHAGTLDPMATGLVIVCVGKGTKHVDSFMAQEKEYTGTIRLGEGTPSYDKESAVEQTAPWEHITDEELLAARDAFLGDIQQVPPMFSAIKIKGKKLYELARKGKEIERPARDVYVSKFDLWRDDADAQNLHFRVVCGKGTYIRSLAHDLGDAVGTHAHLTSLRRERIGDYSVAGSWDILELADAARDRRLRQGA